MRASRLEACFLTPALHFGPRAAAGGDEHRTDERQRQFGVGRDGEAAGPEDKDSATGAGDKASQDPERGDEVVRLVGGNEPFGSSHCGAGPMLIISSACWVAAFT